MHGGGRGGEVQHNFFCSGCENHYGDLCRRRGLRLQCFFRRSHTVNNPALTVTVDQAAGQPDPTAASPINFTVVFSEAVKDFTSSDVTLSGTAGATTAVVTGSGTTYSVAVSGMTSSGTVIASIGAGLAHDSLNDPNSASTSTDNTVTYTKPGVACSLNAGNDLFANPCFEISSAPFDGSVGGPDNWNFYNSGVTGGGTYPAASYYSGTNAAEVHITALPAGGGHVAWSPSPVSVTPGQIYTFSDKYLSNVDTVVDAEYVVAKALDLRRVFGGYGSKLCRLLRNGFVRCAAIALRLQHVLGRHRTADRNGFYDRVSSAQ